MGLIISGSSFLLLDLLPISFGYVWFALLIFLFAPGMGLSFSPNQAAVMNSLPPDQRGAGAGMLNTFQNSAQVLSVGLFFTIVTSGWLPSFPRTSTAGLLLLASVQRPHTKSPMSRLSVACFRRFSVTTRSSSCLAPPEP